jgi:uncharacterized damage-inducible protein DinB
MCCRRFHDIEQQKMTQSDPEIIGNIAALRNNAQIVEDVCGREYSATLKHLENSTIGKHIRHITDFYDCFFAGVQSGAINYDDRQRNPELEQSRSLAARKIVTLCNRLALLGGLEGHISVTSSSDPQLDPVRMGSTLRRELSFLCSHTTHHLAVIALLMISTGRQPRDELGAAASTLKHQHAHFPAEQA